LANRYRKNLRSAIGTSAAPYGYTLATWTTGAVLIHARGVPDTFETLMFMAGAVAGFAFVGILAFGSMTGHFAQESRQLPLWESFHFVSVGFSIGSAALVAHYVESFVVWSLAPFTSTAVYLLVVGAQLTAADKIDRKRE
jgi:hypothetical protein